MPVTDAPAKARLDLRLVGVVLENNGEVVATAAGDVVVDMIDRLGAVELACR